MQTNSAAEQNKNINGPIVRRISPVDILVRAQRGQSLFATCSFAAPLTSQTLLPVPTGYVLLSELTSSWRSLSTELFTGLHLGTCLIGWAALLTCRFGVDFCRQLPTYLLSVRRVLSQLANDAFASAGPKLQWRRQLWGTGARAPLT